MYNNVAKPHKFKIDLYKDNRGHLLAADLQSNIFLKKNLNMNYLVTHLKKTSLEACIFNNPLHHNTSY